jgi:uncharacterized protein YbbC (DUF1343 family)
LIYDFSVTILDLRFLLLYYRAQDITQYVSRFAHYALRATPYGSRLHFARYNYKSGEHLLIRRILLLHLSIIFFLECAAQCSAQPVKLGIDVLMESKLDLLKDKRVGVITNQTGVDSKGSHIIDLLYQAPEVELVALFAPEHGIRGDVEGGYHIDNQKDAKTGVPILSIYGKTKKPTPEMLHNIDVLIFDIQDVGTRFYTYISTMSLCMEAAAENKIEFMVLDRPNPITGTIVEGPILEEQYKSFVGIHPIALRHGVTVGELARMFNEEGWLASGVKAKLTIVPLKNWKRDSWYGELGLEWIKTSPNMPSPTTALLYPGMGLLETCNISEGRGTNRPFENIGAPWLDHAAISLTLKKIPIPGIKIDTTSYIPIDMPGAAINPVYEGQRCNGLFFTISDPHRFLSVAFGIHLICAIKKMHSDKFTWNSPRSPLIMFGNDETPKAIDEGKLPEEIIQSWQLKLEEFKKIRQKYLLYD